MFIIIGILGGILGGMGMGGGTVLIPLLNIFFNVSQHQAQGINLIAFIPMSFLSIYLLCKKKLIKFNGVLLIIIPGVIFCFFGFFVSKSIDGNLLRRFFGAFLIVLSVLYFSNQVSKS